MTTVIAPEPPDAADVLALFAASDAFSHALYPPESNHTVPGSAFDVPGARFLVARLGGRAVGCGGYIPSGAGCAEIKRMFVADAARGTGVGRALLAALEADARAAGLAMLRLETGVTSHAALRLYRAAGFVERGPFGDYRPDALSVFMEKPLGAAGLIAPAGHAT